MPDLEEKVALREDRSIDGWARGWAPSTRGLRVLLWGINFGFVSFVMVVIVAAAVGGHYID